VRSAETPSADGSLLMLKDAPPITDVPPAEPPPETSGEALRKFLFLKG